MTLALFGRSVLTFATHVPFSLPAVRPSFRHRSHVHCVPPHHRHRRLVTSLSVQSAPDAKKRVVFLGTPQVAAKTLSILHGASKRVDSTFNICAVVSQPPALVGRKRVLTPSPVHALAETLSISTILTPSKAGDADFINSLVALSPDLCITAAYGNFLPTKFLKVPRFGTLNIHPSLLPAFRGAAPVPRALEQGVHETGVCILYTVLKMDAGPIAHSVKRPLHGDEHAPNLLEELFDTGAHALVDLLPNVWTESLTLSPQDESLATHAPKLAKDEARLTFIENARIVHNKVRAFAGWPGTWADFVVVNSDDPDGTAGKKQAKGEEIRLKVVRTTVLRDEGGMCFSVHNVSFDEKQGYLRVTCGDGSMLGIIEVQPPGKKVMDARSFWNGLRGKSLERRRLPY